MSPRNSPAVDANLIERARNGDRRSLELLLREVLPLVRRLVFRLAGQHDLDDMVQVVLTQVATHLPLYRQDSRLETWVGGICVNVVRDALRRRGVRKTESLSSDDEFQSPEDLEATVDARAQLAKCRAAFEVLSEAQRTALLLRAVEGYSVQDVAKIMGSAVSTTRMRLYFARKALARALDRVNGGESR